MIKKKDTPPIKYSHTKGVTRHRIAKDRLTVDGVLMIEDGRWIKGKRSHRSSTHPPINFELVISDEDLQRLHCYSLCYEDDFAGHFSNMLCSAIRQAETRARGKHKGREKTLSWIKQEASFLHTLFSYINESDVKPEYFRDLIETIPPDERLYCSKATGWDPVILTAYQLERSYGTKKLMAMGLKPFYSGNDNFESFYITYIQPRRKESEALFKAMLKPILMRIGGIKYLRKKGEKSPFIFTSALARSSDMVPCDKKGKAIDVPPLGKKNPHYKEALTQLFEEIRREPLFDMTF